nr:exodeoxyribonuclease VII small subunit [Eubacterium sp.]
MELEQIMEQLEETVGKLECEKLSLEEAYETFSKGMELVVKGNQAIDKVEKKIEILTQKQEEGVEDESI